MKKHVVTALKLLVFFLGWALLLPLFPDLPTENPAFQRLWYEFTPLLVIAVLTFLFVTLLLEYTGGLLAPILVHFLWNAAGCLVFDAVSLASDCPHILTAGFAGNSWLSGGVYKLEGSAAVLLVNVLLIALMVACLQKQRKAAQVSR